MNIEELDQLWRSPENQPSTDNLNRLRSNLVKQIRHRDRQFAAFITIVIMVLTTITGIAVKNIFDVGGSGKTVDPGREWALLPFLALPWFGAMLLLRRFHRVRSQHPDYEQSIQTTLLAARQHLREAVSRARTILILHTGSIPLAALCIWQLHTVGKVQGNEVASLVAVLSAIILIAMAGSFWMLVRYRKQEQRTSEILRSYETASS